MSASPRDPQEGGPADASAAQHAVPYEAMRDPMWDWLWSLAARQRRALGGVSQETLLTRLTAKTGQAAATYLGMARLHPATSPSRTPADLHTDLGAVIIAAATLMTALADGDTTEAESHLRNVLDQHEQILSAQQFGADPDRPGTTPPMTPPRRAGQP